MGSPTREVPPSNHICPEVPSAQLQVVVSVVDSREWRGRSPGLGGGRPWD